MTIKPNSKVRTPEGEGYAVGWDPDKQEIVVSMINSGSQKWFKVKDVIDISNEPPKPEKVKDKNAIRTHGTRKKR